MLLLHCDVVDYETIRRRHGGDNEPPKLVVRRGRQILALCVRADQQPAINSKPAEVWIDEAEHHMEWSEILAHDTGAVLLYVANGPRAKYRPRGVYHVLGSSEDRVELACRSAISSGERLGRIIFLSGPHWR